METYNVILKSDINKELRQDVLLVKTLEELDKYDK